MPHREYLRQTYRADWPEIDTFVPDLGGDTSLTISAQRPLMLKPLVALAIVLSFPAWPKAMTERTSSGVSAGPMAATSSPSWRPLLERREVVARSCKLA